MGRQLTSEDISNLKAILPTNMRPIIDFLLAKFVDKSLRCALGIGNQRAKSVVKRFDQLAARLYITRTQATLKVGNKVVKTTGSKVKNVKTAIQREMRRLAIKQKLLCEVSRQVE